MSRFKKYLTLFTLSLSGGCIYFLPYLKYVFYDPMLEAMSINNEQAGFLLSLYAIGCIILYIPGGMLADRFATRNSLALSLLGTSGLMVAYALTFDFFLAEIIWVLMAATTAFVFWSALIKAIRLLGEPEEQGRLYGIYYAGNGVAAAIVNSLSLWAFSMFDNPVSGLRAAVLIGAAANTLAAVMVFLLIKEDKKKAVEVTEDDRFNVKDVKVLLKNPLVLYISVLIFCTYGLYTSGSYFNPYLTDVVGVPVEGVGAIGIIRTYLFMLLAPIGGIIADRMKSTSKWFMFCFVALVVVFMSVLAIPKGANASAVIAISLLPGAISLMMYGIMFSTVEECKIPRHMTGTVVGIASIIGYLPDFFFNTLFGKWLDEFGTGGYVYIFTFLGVLGAVGFVFAFMIRRVTKRSSELGVIIAEAENS